MPQISGIRVTKLLGYFDHDIPIKDDWDFAIIYGPNGVGKTKLLELVDAMAGQKYRKLVTIPFEKAEIDFNDGSRLTARMISITDEELDLEIDGRKARLTGSEFTLKFPGKRAYKWTYPGVRQRHSVPPQIAARRLREMGIPITRVGPDMYRHQGSDYYMNGEQVVDQYDETLFVEGRVRMKAHTPPPPEARKFLDEFNVHLIETQRLLNLADRTGPDRGREDKQQPTVVEFAQDLSRRLREAMAENSRISQRLDRAFPKSVLEAQRSKRRPPTESKIRERYDKQSALRVQLSEIAVLDVAPDVELPSQDLGDWERVFLWQYLEDTDKKLASFSQILERTRLFRNIINARFLFKSISIDRNHGFQFKTQSGEMIEPTDLSSGEQHELVLIYNLLFKVAPGSIVLIDEPEISLHVAWQQDFISDIRKIAEIADLQFIVATHSPQVIHHWWSRAISLGPFADQEGEQ